MTNLTNRVEEIQDLTHTYGRIIAAAGYTADELNRTQPHDLVVLGGHVMHDKVVDAVAHSTEFTTIDKTFAHMGLIGARDYDFVGALQTLDDEEKAAIRQRIGWIFPPKKS